ncbi:hypothetical protein EVAR_59934_1 [Eumeta japonica]|uniref:Uncharacterized protein n=1 Tax=Eumeta variegata TaxID=151549 RepID=A0A4C1YU19_EUMVA|nr:hypothetical protein EVAR_59934_1 [Eumeta japonica]
MVPQVDYVLQMSHAARAKLRPILASRLPIRTKIATTSVIYAPTEPQHQRLQAQQNIVLRMIGTDRVGVEDPRTNGRFDSSGLNSARLIGHSLKDESRNSRK